MKKITKNIIDCIRFPFLWTRNRWTGKHYNNWKLLDFISEEKAASGACLWGSLYNDPEEITGPEEIDFDSRIKLRLEIRDGKAWVVKEWIGRGLEKDLCCLEVSDRPILRACWGTTKSSIRLLIPTPSEVNNFVSKVVVIHPLRYFRAKCLEFIHSTILQVFHSIPYSTELDGMPDGWRKAFGIDLCKDLRKALLRSGGVKALLSFRITDIKEKYGSLRLYTGPAPHEVYEVIEKYEELSMRTCITCGAPATWTSRGWVGPYCDLHIPDKGWADPIEDKKEKES